MIIWSDVVAFVKDPNYYVQALGVKLSGNPDGQKTPQICLNNANARVFIDTLNPMKYMSEDGTLLGFEYLVDPLNREWVNEGAISPNAISQEVMGGPMPYRDTTPLAKFVWLLQYEYRGFFSWEGGTSVAFRQYLESTNPAAAIRPRSIINCWEIVLYAAIVAGLVPKATIADAYAHPSLDNNGSPAIGYTVMNKLDTLSKARSLPGVTTESTETPPAHQVGDIIFEPDKNGSTWDEMMHHVFVITKLASDGVFEHHQIMNLWGSLAGGISEQVFIADVIGNGITVYRTVRLG